MEHLPEILLETGTLFIADLHLDLATDEATAGFVRWLDGLDDVPRLVILGDLFDVWVGPAQARLSGAPAVLDALQRRTRRGTAIEIVPGNRDFLLDASFEARTGARLHPEGFIGLRSDADARADQRILFVHGDTLCTLDRGYQRLRRVLRSKPVRWIAPRMPLAIGTRVARRLRRASVRAVAQKLPEEKSIQTSAVVDSARALGCNLLVCGHAHSFRDERLGGGSLRFVVLDAFGGLRDVLRLESSGQFEPRSSASLS
jgi:UDP-2,3-diacylglucosamine hydrolase